MAGGEQTQSQQEEYVPDRAPAEPLPQEYYDYLKGGNTKQRYGGEQKQNPDLPYTDGNAPSRWIPSSPERSVFDKSQTNYLNTIREVPWGEEDQRIWDNRDRSLYPETPNFQDEVVHNIAFGNNPRAKEFVDLMGIFFGRPSPQNDAYLRDMYERQDSPRSGTEARVGMALELLNRVLGAKNNNDDWDTWLTNTSRTNDLNDIKNVMKLLPELHNWAMYNNKYINPKRDRGQ